jgi:tripartite-type tricarboxylate transporter receptor subunit TctC
MAEVLPLPSLQRRAQLAAAGMAATGAFAPGTQANVRILVGAPAGGSTDSMARALATEFGGALRRVVVVENRPGAGGNLAAELVAVLKYSGAKAQWPRHTS